MNFDVSSCHVLNHFSVCPYWWVGFASCVGRKVNYRQNKKDFNFQQIEYACQLLAKENYSILGEKRITFLSMYICKRKEKKLCLKEYKDIDKGIFPHSKTPNWLWKRIQAIENNCKVTNTNVTFRHNFTPQTVLYGYFLSGW